MNNLREDIKQNARLRSYLELVNKIAKVEYKSLNSAHLIEFEELVNIGIHTVDTLTAGKNSDQYNDSYLSTAIKWAIRNEMRRRYRWHGVKNEVNLDEGGNTELREVIYKTILSTDEMMDADKPVEVRDEKKTPEENAEFLQLSCAIKDAISKLPKREKDLIEAKFFNAKKLQDLSEEYEISPSRISRIIRAGLDKIKAELIKNEIV